MAMIYSFGYKMNGEGQFATTGPSAPLVLDCRGINNPHNDANLRRLTGRDKAVQHRVLKSSRAQAILKTAWNHLQDNPNGSVAFGCSYGKHRSVALAEVLHDLCRDNIPATVVHTGAAAHRRYA